MQIHKIRTNTVVIGTILKISLDVLIQNYSFVDQNNRGKQADCSSADLVDRPQMSGFIVIECADGRGKPDGSIGISGQAVHQRTNLRKRSIIGLGERKNVRQGIQKQVDIVGKSRYN